MIVTTPTSTIYADFNAYIRQFGHPLSSWYVGITSDIDQRLFSDHAVSRTGAWIWRRAESHRESRDIEMAYHDAGCRGSHGGGNYTAVYIYAYLITQTTVE
jgi:hypothetical protein